MWRLQCVVESAEFAKATGERTNYGPCFELGMTSPGKMRTPKLLGGGSTCKCQVGGRRRAETVLDPQMCRTWIRGSKGVARKEKPLTASHL